MCRTICQSTIDLPGTTALEKQTAFLHICQSLVAPRSVVDWLLLMQVLYREAQLLCIHKCCALHVQKTLFCSISAQCLALKTFLSPLL